MQCFEAEVTRTFLLAMCRELNPSLARDDLLLDSVLEDYQVDSAATLFSLPEETLSDMLRQLTVALPLAA